MGIKEQEEIRQRLIDEIELDLIGPRKGKTPQERQNEVLPGNRNPKNEYVAGVMYPGNWEVEDEDKIQEVGGDTDEEDNNDSNVANDKLFKPSSFGLTCRLDPTVKEIKGRVEYGIYQSLKEKESKYRTFQRIPKTEPFTITVVPGEKEIKFKANSKFCINYTIIEDQISDTEKYLVLDLYVINRTERKIKNNFTDFMFQPKIFLESINDENSFIQDRTGINQEYFPAEEEHLEILFKEKVSFGKGHLCSLSWDKANIQHKKLNEKYTFSINKINTSFIPQETTEFIEATENDNLESSIHMSNLGNCKNQNDLSNMLEPLIEEYANWINQTKTEVKNDEKFDESEREIILDLQIKKAENVVQRMKDGLACLKSDEKAFESFKFANNAIAWQQVHYKWAADNAEKGEVDSPDLLEPIYNGKEPKWRLFQIAFILMNLESIVNPTSDNRKTVDLLWFPTGGGKTEAYLGLVAFTIAYRRLRGYKDGAISDQSLGTAVLMRYTLRLLTVQQFQRAATLMCACEKLRLQDKKKWGEVPFQIGLWVGSSVTPNSHLEAKIEKSKIKRSRDQSLTSIKSKNPYVLINCPWCGNELKYSNGEVGGTPEQWRLYCSRTKCLFAKHLDVDPDVSIPVVIVDDDIYTRCPSLIISTVDKFAQIAWKPEVKSIFGKVSHHCDQHGFFDNAISSGHNHNGKKPDPVTLLPPELIIQDELHLISGPLGTLTGLYETAIEYLCTNDEIQPKIIASTATTKAASDQIRTLFARDNTEIFPPQIAKFGETFFSNVNPERSAKTYVGVLATGKSGLTVLAKVSSVILRRIRQFEEDGEYSKEDLDPYFTLVTYYNSQRELGGASMNFNDSVPDFIKQIKNNFDDSPVLLPITETGEELSVEESETVETTEEESKEEEQKHQEVLRPYQFKDLLTEELTSRKSSGEIPQTLRTLNDGISKIEPNENKWNSDGQPIDVLMATNMLSVGVDIGRLGAMIVNGQPKNNSEYIQATGRIGRQNPGLIITLYAYTKPRDLSYYENFKDYHSTYYKNVEVVALTPFTLRARKIGLFGIMVGMFRMAIQGNYSLTKNNDAHQLNQKNVDHIKLIDNIKNVIQKRVEMIDREESAFTKTNVQNLLDRWTMYIKRYGKLLHYKESQKYPNETYMYLNQNDPSSPRQLIPVPTSLRNAEQEQNFFYVDTDADPDKEEKK